MSDVNAPRMLLTMSLRDWFAGQALSGVCCPDPDTMGTAPPITLAKYAYQIADAMLSERPKAMQHDAGYDLVAIATALSDAWCGSSLSHKEFFSFFAGQAPALRAAIAKATGD